MEYDTYNVVFSLKVSEMVQNQECGIRVSDEEFRFQAGDVLLAVETRMENDVCKWDPGF